MESGEKVEDILEENEETGSILQDESVEERNNIEEDSDSKQEKISDVEEARGTAYGQHTGFYRESWGLPSAMTEEDSDNNSTDNEEFELISVNQTIEANGEMIRKGGINPHSRQSSKEKCCV